jgi:transcriptional regulator with XRE-family HTH domain
MNYQIGFQIRKKRKEVDITLTEIAKQLKISPSLLSQIENGKVSPSVNTLHRIAKVLNTSIGDLFYENIDEEHVVVKKVDRINKNNDKSHPIVGSKGINISILSPKKANVEFLFLQYEEFASTGNDFVQHEGEEYIYVLKGRIEVNLNEKKFILDEGEFMWFMSDIPHKIRNVAEGISKAIWVDYPPKF